MRSDIKNQSKIFCEMNNGSINMAEIIKMEE